MNMCKLQTAVDVKHLMFPTRKKSSQYLLPSSDLKLATWDHTANMQTKLSPMKKTSFDLKSIAANSLHATFCEVP